MKTQEMVATAIERTGGIYEVKRTHIGVLVIDLESTMIMMPLRKYSRHCYCSYYILPAK